MRTARNDGSQGLSYAVMYLLYQALMVTLTRCMTSDISQRREISADRVPK